ncbi:MAG: hypothetical protein KDI53_18630 [Candidatus Accumulibacter sp.]|nr:hypothetical protein [Accumulibacter sp.]
MNLASLRPDERDLAMAASARSPWIDERLPDRIEAPPGRRQRRFYARFTRNYLGAVSGVPIWRQALQAKHRIAESGHPSQ